MDTGDVYATAVEAPDPLERRPSEYAAAVLREVTAAFLEMPGLKLTTAQAARLCALDLGTCDAALQQLVATGFLVRTPQAMYARASEISSGA